MFSKFYFRPQRCLGRNEGSCEQYKNSLNSNDDDKLTTDSQDDYSCTYLTSLDNLNKSLELVGKCPIKKKKNAKQKLNYLLKKIILCTKIANPETKKTKNTKKEAKKDELEIITKKQSDKIRFFSVLPQS